MMQYLMPALMHGAVIVSALQVGLIKFNFMKVIEWSWQLISYLSQRNLRTYTFSSARFALTFNTAPRPLYPAATSALRAG